MARTPRFDAPGRRHHVFNRAAGRQILLADRRDYRRFLMLLACSVRRGELVVDAYCLMATHFHLVAASPTGELAYAMMRIQNAYSRYKNRRSRKDGPVMRGRYGSRPVLSTFYCATPLRYMAHNSCSAGIQGHPMEHPWSSAGMCARQTVPKWFDRAGVERRLGFAYAETDVVLSYAKLIRASITAAEAEFIEQRQRRPASGEDDLNELVRRPSACMEAWVERKTRAAGGRSPWGPLASASRVRTVVEEARLADGPWELRIVRTRSDGWSLLEAGLLALMVAQSSAEIARTMGCHRATAARWRRQFMAAFRSSPDFAERAARVARRVLPETLAKVSDPDGM